MIKYEDYSLPCPLLKTGKSSEPDSFIRSNFEYYPRQRATYRGTVKSGFSIRLPLNQVINFQNFWKDLHYGADRFEASFLVHATVGDKVLRFIDKPTFTALGNNIYDINVPLEVLEFTTILTPPLYNCNDVALKDCNDVALPSCIL